MARTTRRSGHSKPRKQRQHIKTGAEHMAALYVQARATLVRAGRALHDHVGSPLTAAGVQLQLLRMDLPEAATRIGETLQLLEDVLDRVRNLSQELCPSPAYRGGLKQALLRLADQHGSPGCRIDVDYAATAVVPAEIAAAMHEAAGAAVETAVQRSASRVTLSVRGAAGVVLRITDDGKKTGRARALAPAAMLAREQGLKFVSAAGNGTIVIRYAARRSPRR